MGLVNCYHQFNNGKCIYCRVDERKFTWFRRKRSSGLRQRVIERDKKCLNCGNRKNLTIDHIVPVSAGGTDDIVNLQTLCGDCNSKKGDQIIWYMKFKRKEQ